ncbi:MAG: 16S rRNA (cytidine(1402)-2'-O)-methyltransferase [Candidatus Omnitrophica bacterium]|nr:16S rRNA (cytidine(1402)-2'-O)-methyltransferase [Candidatus Omnitrophota bacterium]
MPQGKIYLVATPIGNLKDISFRAIETLQTVDHILCEDTRTSAKLLKSYGIQAKTSSFHDHNKAHKTPAVIKRIQAGENTALISDAGTPGISDPGFYLVREALKEGIEITTVPGPSAFLSALVISGLPTDRFVFEGFLPKKNSRRAERLRQLINETRTTIFYESPHRIKNILPEMMDIVGDRDICLARELTKVYEQIFRGSISGAIKAIDSGGFLVKGELVIILAPKSEKCIQ